jgi:HAD superfamily hydrolase (TIGR01509 family)
VTNRRVSGTRAQGRALKNIIFDMDGTLVSSIALIYHCVDEITKKYTGTHLTLDEVKSKFGPPRRTLIRSFIPGLSDDLQNKAVKDYYECYRRNAPDKVLVFPGITNLLTQIRSSGRHLALVTGIEKEMMEYTLSPFGLGTFFEDCITIDDVRNRKPDPEGILLALARIGASATESIYIGDSPADIVAGKRAGVLIGAAVWSPQTHGDPTKEHPDFEFHSVQQISVLLFPNEEA